MIGKKHSEVVKGTLDAAQVHGLKVDRLSAAQVAARFPDQSSSSNNNSSIDGLFHMSEGDVALYVFILLYYCSSFFLFLFVMSLSLSVIHLLLPPCIV